MSDTDIPRYSSPEDSAGDILEEAEPTKRRRKVDKQWKREQLEIFSFAQSSTTMTAESSKTPELQAVSGNAYFAKEVYKILAKQEGNIVFSPISAHACLSMLYQGVSGPFLEDFARALQLATPSIAAEGYKSIIHALNSSGEVTVLMANKIYLGRNLKTSFKSIVEDNFQSEVETINFGDTVEASKMINQWVEEKTQGKIKDLFEPKDLITAVLALVNTLYFKGDWIKKFKEKFTTPLPFHIDNKTSIDVPTMNMTESLLYKESKELNAKIVELNYKNRDYSLVIILPNEIEGISDLEKKLVNIDITDITEGAESTLIYLFMPKFKLETSLGLEPILKTMGLEGIFHPSNHLDGLVDSAEGLFVSKATQKVYIKVDENGSEAAAATKLALTKRSGRRLVVEPIELRIDHPFIFLLTHKREDVRGSRNILFYGRVVRPFFE